MALHDLYGGASLEAGNGNSFAGSFISGVCFTLLTGGCWLTAYQYYVVGGIDPGPTVPQKFALWCATGPGAGTLVPGSVVTSGTLAPGWNQVNLATPVPLAIGTLYVAATGVNGNFCQVKNQFGAGNPFAAGITSGPLFGYSDTGGSAPAQYTFPQGVFSTGGSDPSTTLPSTGSSSGNFGIDVLISDTTPAGYSGTFRLYPNKFDTNSSTVIDAALNYDICTEIDLSQACTVSKVWYYSFSGAASHATQAAIWSIPSGLIVLKNASPVWSGAAGSGWVSTPVTGTLPAGKYRVGVYNSGGTGGQWGATDKTTDYWGETLTTGAGRNGILNGPMLAPGYSAAQLGFNYNAADGGASPPFSDGTTRAAQCVFGQTPGGADIFPQLVAQGTAGNTTQNYWTDMEVTPVPAPAGGDDGMPHLLMATRRLILA